MGKPAHLNNRRLNENSIFYDHPSIFIQILHYIFISICWIEYKLQKYLLYFYYVRF